MAFDYNLDFQIIDFRARPDLYRVGRSEQGVLLVQPYKDELLPHWRFKTPAIAHASASTLYEKYLSYKAKDDFVGMDMARKFIQMGYTRSRRYVNHRSGRKWNEGRTRILPMERDEEKAESARIFFRVLQWVRNDVDYKRMLTEHQRLFEHTGKISHAPLNTHKQMERDVVLAW